VVSLLFPRISYSIWSMGVMPDPPACRSCKADPRTHHTTATNLRSYRFSSSCSARSLVWYTALLLLSYLQRSTCAGMKTHFLAGNCRGCKQCVCICLWFCMYAAYIHAHCMYIYMYVHICARVNDNIEYKGQVRYFFTTRSKYPLVALVDVGV
jgi:hypothetical protein